MIRNSDVDAWVVRALEGDDAAWVCLLGALWDHVEARVGASRHMGQLRGSVDDRREVVSRVFARLRRNDLRALRTFPAWQTRNPGKMFDDWLSIVVANVIRDYVSERLGDCDPEGRGLKRLLHTLADALDAGDVQQLRPAITSAVAARELIEIARARLPSDQLAALAAWLGGADFDDIATTHGMSSAAAARDKIRAALARLRRELRTPPPTEARP